jgi:HAD superfamily hydrolase (TIGR01544 family)
VISDFDQTLTPFYKRSDTADSPGAAREQESSSHGLLMSSRVVDPAVSAAERELFARYFPIEMSPKLSREEKLPFMIEWWTRAHELLVEHRLTRAQIRQAVAQSRLSFRPGFHALFAQLEAAQIPTLVFSAGLYDVIHEVLAKEFTATANRPVPANVHVVSNMMRFDADGTLEGFQGSLIHSFNKNATVLLDSSFWRQCKIERRSNVLLLGDSRGDVNMAQGLDCTDDEIIRVGFLNVHVDDAIDEYLALYDVVLTHDGSLEPVALLLEQLLAHESHQKPQ